MIKKSTGDWKLTLKKKTLLLECGNVKMAKELFDALLNNHYIQLLNPESKNEKV